MGGGGGGYWRGSESGDEIGVNPAHQEAGPRDVTAGAVERPAETGEAGAGGKRVWLNLDDVSDEKLLSFFCNRTDDLSSLEDVTPPEHRSTDAEHRDTEPDANPDVAEQAEPDRPELTVTDVDTVERHLGRLDHSPANDAMTSRIRDAMADGRPLTEGERNFMAHELTEAGLMDDGMPYEDAHELASETHPLMRNYDPEVIEQFPELFNDNWRRTWGLDPR